MSKLWPPLLALLSLFMGGQPAPAGWPGGEQTWVLAAAVVLLVAVFGFLSLSSAFFQSAVVRCAYLLSRDWDRANRFYFVLMRPGVLIHELAHAIAALLVGGKVVSFNVLETKVMPGARGGTQVRLGHVGYTVPGRSGTVFRLKDAFVGFAPLPLGIALIALTIALSGVDWSLGILPALQLAAGDWRAWVATIVIVELADNMIPSRTDRKNWPAALLILAVVLIVAYLLANFANQRGLAPLPDLLPNVAGATTFLAVVLLAPIVINLVFGAILRLLFELLHRR